MSAYGPYGPHPVERRDGILRCGRCLDSYFPSGWRIRLVDGANICFTCAHGDDYLHHWQAFCDVANSFPDVLATAPNEETRWLLASMLSQAAMLLVEPIEEYVE